MSIKYSPIGIAIGDVVKIYMANEFICAPPMHLKVTVIDSCAMHPNLMAIDAFQLCHFFGCAITQSVFFSSLVKSEQKKNFKMFDYFDTFSQQC